MINSLLDSVLDRTVVGGYTNVGYRIRSRGWSTSELPQMDGKVVLITVPARGSASPPLRALRAWAPPCGWLAAARSAASTRA